MEKKNLVKFDNIELEMITSDSELSEVRGGKINLGTLLDLLMGGSSEVNNNCNCNCNG